MEIEEPSFGERVAFARDGFDQRGFAAAVGAEDADVFAGADLEGDVVEGGAFAAHDGDVVQGEQRGLGRFRGHFVVSLRFQGTTDSLA